MSRHWWSKYNKAEETERKDIKKRLIIFSSYDSVLIYEWLNSISICLTVDLHCCSFSELAISLSEGLLYISCCCFNLQVILFLTWFCLDI